MRVSRAVPSCSSNGVEGGDPQLKAQPSLQVLPRPSQLRSRQAYKHMCTCIVYDSHTVDPIMKDTLNTGHFSLGTLPAVPAT